MEWNQIAWYVLAVAGGLLIGHALGAKDGRKATKRSQQQLNDQSLDLLEARASLTQFQKQGEQRERKDRLLQLTLTKLKDANGQLRSLREQQHAKNQQHFVEMSSMHLRAAEACETARKACEIAINTTTRLDKISQGSGLTKLAGPKPFGVDDGVKLSLAERARVYGSSNAITSVRQRETSELLSSKNAGAN